MLIDIAETGIRYTLSPAACLAEAHAGRPSHARRLIGQGESLAALWEAVGVSLIRPGDLAQDGSLRGAPLVIDGMLGAIPESLQDAADLVADQIRLRNARAEEEVAERLALPLGGWIEATQGLQVVRDERGAYVAGIPDQPGTAYAARWSLQGRAIWERDACLLYVLSELADRYWARARQEGAIMDEMRRIEAERLLCLVPGIQEEQCIQAERERLRVLAAQEAEELEIAARTGWLIDRRPDWREALESGTVSGLDVASAIMDLLRHDLAAAIIAADPMARVLEADADVLDAGESIPDAGLSIPDAMRAVAIRSALLEAGHQLTSWEPEQCISGDDRVGCLLMVAEFPVLGLDVELRIVFA